MKKIEDVKITEVEDLQVLEGIEEFDPEGVRIVQNDNDEEAANGTNEKATNDAEAANDTNENCPPRLSGSSILLPFHCCPSADVRAGNTNICIACALDCIVW